MQQATAMTPRKVAIFDFDGTLVDGQSGALFTTYLLRHGIMRLPRALHLGWWGLRYKLHLPYRQSEARELVFGALADLDPSTVDEVMHRFHDEVLLPRYRRQACEEVDRRRKEGCVTLLVSATFKAMADVAARTLGMDAAVATLMEKDAQGRYTGRVQGDVIAGPQKYAVASAWCDKNLGQGAWELAYAYGDHHSDVDLLSRAKEAFAVCPGSTLRPIAKAGKSWTGTNSRMEIARKTDYALRMLATLATDPAGVVSVREVARANGVPYSFARSIQHDLALAGIVENSRGANGGMRLAVDPREVTLLCLVEAVQGPLALCGCDAAGADGGPCERRGACGFNPIWCNAEAMLRSFFGSVTLWQVVEEGCVPRFTGGFELLRPQEGGAVPGAAGAPDEKDSHA